MGVFEYNGVSFETDFFNIDFLKKYEEAKAEMSEGIAKIQKDEELPASERFELVMDEIDSMFAAVFGKKAVKEIFGKSRSLKDRIEAVTLLLKAEQSMETEAVKLGETLHALK